MIQVLSHVDEECGPVGMLDIMSRCILWITFPTAWWKSKGGHLHQFRRDHEKQLHGLYMRSITTVE